MSEVLKTFAAIAAEPIRYAREWKAAANKPVLGVLPMHFPCELAHAAGGLATVLQEDDVPVAAGLGSQFTFYCGFNRSLVDQVVRGEFNGLDAVLCADHCVQLLGTADIMRARAPEVPVIFNQLISSMSMPWAFEEARKALVSLREQTEEALGLEITDEALRRSIKIYNKDRQLMRRLYALRKAGKISISSRDVQAVVKSAMVMDKEQHILLLEQLLAELEAKGPGAGAGIPIYLSGHFCHAPKLEILEAIEECGARVVDDDLYHGFRHIATDVDETGDPIDALTNWYFAQNKNVPCATLADTEADLDTFLVDAVKRSGAQGIIVLLVKFCEPHLYFYPEIKERCDQNGIPNLLIETEHEGIPIESMKTRIEAFLEIAKRRAAA